MGMKAGPSDDPFGIEAEINMIPLIDVALVLLIIFMVMTPALVRSQIQVTLPKAGSLQRVPPDLKPIEIQVTKEGTVYVDGQPLSPQALENLLETRAANAENQPIIVSGDKAAALEHVVRVMDTAKRLGFRKLGLGVQPEKAAPRR